jgi:signal transduction histidine kinase
VRGLRLQHRIVVPFVLVALVAAAGSAMVALSVTSDALESRLRTQLQSAAAVISRGDFALSPVILQYLGEVIGAHIVTMERNGRIVASTTTNRPEVVAAAQSAIAIADAGGDLPPEIGRANCGAPCLVAVRRVQGRPELYVALIAETSELAIATRAVARAIFLGATVSVVVMLLVSQAVVRRVTAPLEKLVRFARELSPHDRRRRAKVGDDEIGALARAFNEMLDRLDQSQDALVRSEKLGLAGLIAARVAHDIRNPMSSIKMQTQLVRARLAGDEEEKATLTAILHDIEQVESVIRDLLELARPGQLKLEPASVNAVLREALQQLSAQFTHRKITVEARLGAVPPVLLDTGRFKQVLLNVLINASDAMPTGGTIAVTSAEDGPSAARIDICDDGIGVDPAILDRVFDPFVSSKRDGVGLGLVNAKAVVEGHGGRIRLDPRQPKGTCASIWLPIRTNTST